MRLKRLFVAALGIGVTMLFASSAVAQHDDHDHGDHGHDKNDHAAHGGDDDGEAAMMAMWANMSAPGEHHKHLDVLIGKWTYTIKWRMSPEMPWTNDKGTSENEWLLDGRYVRQHVIADPPKGGKGMRFEGNGILGYDKMTHKHFSAWIDNMSTSLMTSEGTCDDSGKTITLTGTMKDPMTGKDKTARSVTRVINKDRYVLEMYEVAPNGKEYMAMEIINTRK